MRKAAIIPLTVTYAVGDQHTPAPGVVLSDAPWVHGNRLETWTDRPEWLRPSLDGETAWGTVRNVHGMSTSRERGLLVVTTYRSYGDDAAEARSQAAARALALPSLAAQVLAILMEGVAKLPVEPFHRAMATLPLPELPSMFQLSTVRPQDVHRTWAEHTAREAAIAERDAQLASVKARRREADRTARERVALILDDERDMPATDYDGKVKLCWADLETLLNRYANATTTGKS
jgi:hypothetical protein